LEIIAENIDRIAAEQLEADALQQAVPKFFQPYGCGELFRAPQDPDHLAVSPETAIYGACAKPLDLAANRALKLMPVRFTRHHEPGERGSRIQKRQAAAVLRKARIPTTQRVELPYDRFLMFRGRDDQYSLALLQAIREVPANALAPRCRIRFVEMN